MKVTKRRYYVWVIFSGLIAVLFTFALISIEGVESPTSLLIGVLFFTALILSPNIFGAQFFPALFHDMWNDKDFDDLN